MEGLRLTVWHLDSSVIRGVTLVVAVNYVKFYSETDSKICWQSFSLLSKVVEKSTIMFCCGGLYGNGNIVLISNRFYSFFTVEPAKLGEVL